MRQPTSPAADWMLCRLGPSPGTGAGADTTRVVFASSRGAAPPSNRLHPIRRDSCGLCRRNSGKSYPPSDRRHVASKRFLAWRRHRILRSEEHTSELQSLMRISYAVFCLKKKLSFISLHHQLFYFSYHI